MPSNHEFPLRFASSTEDSQGSYKLLELPQELCKVVENGLENQFTIRGRVSDDAVLCTAEKTYSVRAVTLSNTFVVATGPSDTSQLGPEGASASDLIVRDQVCQILELVPSVPKLHRLKPLLKGCEYEEGHEDDGEVGSGGDDYDDEKPKKFTMNDVRSQIQASDVELIRGIKRSHILEIDGHLRPLAPLYLTRILESLLTALVSQALPLPPRPAPVNQLTYHLDLEHEIPRRITQQVLPWFGVATGNSDDEWWNMDVKEVVKHIGLGHLMLHKDDPVKIAEFLEKWNTAVGDTFASSVDLTLLEGNYLLTPAPAPTASASPTHLTYFPASDLPVTATHLFADLFVMRPRWRESDILPFLGTVAIDQKERDKLLMKYARSTTDPAGGVWYTARATHV